MDNIQDPQLLRLIVIVMGAVMTILISVVGFVAKWAIGNVLTKMDEFLDEVRKLTDTATQHGKDLDYLKKNDGTQDERLNKHGKAIQDIDLKVATCQAKHL